MSTSKVFVMAMALGLGLAAQGAEGLAEAKRHFQTGQALFSAGDYEHAVVEFREAYHQHPDPALLFNIGQAMRLWGHFADARFYYSKYLENAPETSNRATVKQLIIEVDAKLAAAKARTESTEKPEPSAPDFNALDASLVRGGVLCIAPIYRTSRPSDAKPAELASQGDNFEAAQQLLSDVAEDSPLLNGALILDSAALNCGLDDAICIANMGALSGCQSVLVGSVNHDGNRISVRARLVDIKTAKPIAKLNAALQKLDDTELFAWLEGVACRTFRVNCATEVKLDADRPEMEILVDGKAIERKPSRVPGVRETVVLLPGVYQIAAAIGARKSVETALAIRRHQAETIYVRQGEDGALTLLLQSAMKPGEELPPPSRDFVIAPARSSRAPRIAGLVAAGLGVVGIGIGTQQYLHSESLVNGANGDYSANGGAYTPADVASLSAAKSAHTNSTIFDVVGACLIAAGGALVFAFWSH